jgi:replication-associated recombination protein RarA
VGPPGTGKTTLAQAIARTSGRRFVELSAVTAGVKDVREVMQEAMTARPVRHLDDPLPRRDPPLPRRSRTRCCRV